MAMNNIQQAQPIGNRQATTLARIRSSRFMAFLNRNFIWVLLIIFMAGATLANPVFIKPANIFNILLSSAYLGCLALGQSIVLLTGNFDLSAESNMIFVAIIGGILIAPTTLVGGEPIGGGLGLPWVVGLIAIFVVAGIVGLINGLMVAKLKMNNFMVTLATQILLVGLALVVGEGRLLTNIPMPFRYIGSGKIAGLPVAAIFLIILFIVAHFFLTRTIFGRRLYAVGSNANAARAAGIDNEMTIIFAYIVCGLLSGLAAFVLVGRLGSVSASISSGALFLSVAAAVIGGVSLSGGRGNASGILGGLLLISVINNALNMAQIESNLIRVVQGSVILIAVLIDAVRSRK